MQDVLARLHVGVGNFGPAHAGVFEDALVDEFLDVGDLVRRERAAVEVEGQLFRPDVGAFLRGVLAHDFVQRPVEQVRNGMVALDGVAARLVHGEFARPFVRQLIGLKQFKTPRCLKLKVKSRASFDAVRNLQRLCQAWYLKLTCIADLSSHLGVERRDINNSEIVRDISLH